MSLSSVSSQGVGPGEEAELGGLFWVSRPEKSKNNRADADDCSRFPPDSLHNWDLEEVFINSSVTFLSSLLILDY